MSDTFFITSIELFNDLSANDKWEIVQELASAIIDNQLVSIRGEMIEEMDGEFYPVLYGVYRLKSGEFSNYQDAGGLWDYEKPAYYLNKFTDTLKAIDEIAYAALKAK